jgi:hypothetical protein
VNSPMWRVLLENDPQCLKREERPAGGRVAVPGAGEIGQGRSFGAAFFASISFNQASVMA